jgi:hypothetical protein
MACAGSSSNGESEIFAARPEVLQRDSTAAKFRTALKERGTDVIKIEPDVIL